MGRAGATWGEKETGCYIKHVKRGQDTGYIHKNKIIKLKKNGKKL